MCKEAPPCVVYVLTNDMDLLLQRRYVATPTFYYTSWKKREKSVIFTKLENVSQNVYFFKNIQMQFHFYFCENDRFSQNVLIIYPSAGII